MPNNKATIIAIDGLDCSFKETNCHKLMTYLNETLLPNKQTYLFSFPSYNETRGYFASNYLSGIYGPINSIDPTLASIFYLMDFYDTYHKNLDLFENPNNIIILDRWTLANKLYHPVKDLNKFTDILVDICYIESKFKLPEPDGKIFLNNLYDIPKQLRHEKNNGDIHESDDTYMELVYHYATNTAAQFDYNIIDCFDENNNISSRDEIFNKILDFLRKDEKVIFKDVIFK